MKPYDFNFVVIGGGSGGLVASYLGSALGAKVALVEAKKMGGDCLNTGCVPSKALLKTAKILSLKKKSQAYGIRKIEMEYTFQEIQERVKSVIRQIEPNDSVERYQKLGVHCYESFGKILSPHEVSAGNKLLRTHSIVIASGARPTMPAIPGLREMGPLNSDSIWDLKELPKKLLVLGGGAIGVELALAFARLGSKVTIVERNARLLPKEDPDVGDFLAKKFAEEGIEVLLSTQANEFQLKNECKVMLAEQGGKITEHSFHEVLVALGRSPNTKGFGLEELGIQLRENGSIAADQFMRTTVKNIFVCGDVTGPLQFTHFASLTGSTSAINALFRPFKVRANYDIFPWAIFTDPEIARVGLNEIEANLRGLDYEVTHFPLTHLDRALTEAEAEGFVKVLTQKGKDKILGACIVGPSAGELIIEFTIAMKFGLGLKKILSVIHPYPTLMEANRFVAGAWSRNHAPPWGLKFLMAFHRWRRNFQL